MRWLLLAVVAACHAAPDHRLHDIAQQALTDEHIAGLAVHVEQNGKVLLHEGFGTTHGGSGAAINADDVFAIGSVTKSFTAAAILTLVEQHAIALADPIAKYVPELAGDPTTIQQLLWQTSGFDDFATLVNVGKSRAEIVKWIASSPHLFPPGSKFHYSNTNYLLLGMVVEAASGETYEHYLAEHVIAPLHLTATAPCTAALVPRPTIAGTQRAHDGVWFDPRHYGGAGELCSNTRDLAHYATSVLTGALVSAESVKVLTTPPPGGDYAAGWVIDHVGTHRRIWHNGGVPGGYASHVAWFPDDKLVIVLLSNSDAFEAIGELDAHLARAVLGMREPPPAPPQPKRGSGDDPWG